MRILTLALLSSVLGLHTQAQGTSSAPAGTTTLPGSPSPSKTFYAVGMSFLPQSSPKPSGWAAVVTPISSAQKIYSISETDFTFVRTVSASVLPGFSVQTSVRTGFAVWLRAFGSANLYALGDGGMATTGAVSSAAASGGGFVTFPVRGILAVIGARVLKTVAGTQTYGEIGVAWGK